MTNPQRKKENRKKKKEKKQKKKDEKNLTRYKDKQSIIEI